MTRFVRRDVRFTPDPRPSLVAVTSKNVAQILTDQPYLAV